MAKKVDKVRQVSKAHVVYKTSDGRRVPGVTTIIGLRAKPQLVAWANRLGLDGIDANAYRDEAADIGTLAHEMVQADLQGTKVDYDRFSLLQKEQAENALISFWAWTKGHEIEPLLCEQQLVSDTFRYGGTIDCFCSLDGIPTLLDFKTGKAIYDEYFMQLAAYSILLSEAGYDVREHRILRIGRDETEGFEERSVTNVKPYWNCFYDLLNLYYHEKEIRA